MADRLRFYIDEHVPGAVTEGLQRRGIDLLTARESDMLAASDTEHLALAREQQRVIFTQDADFLRRTLLVSLTLELSMHLNKPRWERLFAACC